MSLFFKGCCKLYLYFPDGYILCILWTLSIKAAAESLPGWIQTPTICPWLTVWQSPLKTAGPISAWCSCPLHCWCTSSSRTWLGVSDPTLKMLIPAAVRAKWNNQGKSGSRRSHTGFLETLETCLSVEALQCHPARPWMPCSKHSDCTPYSQPAEQKAELCSMAKTHNAPDPHPM